MARDSHFRLPALRRLALPPLVERELRSGARRPLFYWLRGLLALDESVRLAFLNGDEKKVLVVTSSGRPSSVAAPAGYEMEVLSVDEFARHAADRSPSLEAYLSRGVDLLGRREDVIWRRIEAAGYQVRKEQGVP